MVRLLFQGGLPPAIVSLDRPFRNVAFKNVKNCRTEQRLRIILRATRVISHGLKRGALRVLVDKKSVAVRVENVSRWSQGFNQTSL